MFSCHSTGWRSISQKHNVYFGNRCRQPHVIAKPSLYVDLDPIFVKTQVTFEIQICKLSSYYISFHPVLPDILCIIKASRIATKPRATCGVLQFLSTELEASNG